MNISLNTALYNSQGVDVNNVEKVANKILSASNGKEATITGIDYSKFNRSTLGIDLYSPRTNVELQRQIATNQTGLYLKSIDVSQLNSSAAMSLYSASNVQKNVSMMQSVQDMELIAPKIVEKQTQNIKTFETADKNSNSSNTFNPFNKNEGETKDNAK